MDTINIKELDVNRMIYPTNETYNDPNDTKGGSRIIVIGGSGSGKSKLIKSLIYSKKHMIPCGMFMSGSEDNNHDLNEYIPDLFVYNSYDEKSLESLIKRQKYAQKYKVPNPWCLLLLDDVTDSSKIFNSEIQSALFKRGRHMKLMYILSLQYALDLRATLRNSIDGVFILREPSPKIRRKLWENYAGIIPDFKMFCDMMDQLTTDHTAIYIHNRSTSNNIEDCVYYYRADIKKLDSFKFGCPEFWKCHHERYDQNYSQNG